MRNTAPIRPLSAGARRVLTAVASQLARHDEAVQGLCANGQVIHTKHGRFGPDEPPEQIEERLDDPEGQMKHYDFLPLFTGSAFERFELPSSHPNELRVRAQRRTTAASDTMEMAGADFTFKNQSAELVHAILHPPNLRGVVGFMFDSAHAELLFSYVNGVPLPVRMEMRTRSRGIGRFRLDQESIVTVRYVPCS